MQPFEIALWLFMFAVAMACTCWRLPVNASRRNRCTKTVSSLCVGTRKSSWIHGDMGEATEISKPVYQYEYAGETHVVAAGIPTMLFGHSPTAHSADEPIELLVNPAKPTEIYDPIYERWFARYRVAWGLGAFLVGGISITLFNMLVFA